MLTEDGAIPLAIPRDRTGTFEPQLVPKNARRLPRFDQNVISLYAPGMSVREIREHLEELYQDEVTPSLISTVTEAPVIVMPRATTALRATARAANTRAASDRWPDPGDRSNARHRSLLLHPRDCAIEVLGASSRSAFPTR